MTELNDRLFPHYLLGQFIGLTRCSDFMDSGYIITQMHELAKRYDAWNLQGRVGAAHVGTGST
jgi:hypothetical protein